MGGYIPWLPAGIFTAAKLQDERLMPPPGQPSCSARCRFKAPGTNDAAGLSLLLPCENHKEDSVLRRRIAAAAPKRNEKLMLELLLDAASHPAVYVSPLESAVAPGPCHEDDAHDEGSDTDSIASDDWAEALWSPGRNVVFPPYNPQVLPRNRGGLAFSSAF